MTKTELLEIIANGENSGIEFKRDDIKPEQFAKEVVAMSNFQGGKVILGVEDDGSITGVQRVKLEEWVMNIFRDKIHPMIIPFYEEVKMDSNNKIAVVSFPQGISKPYVVRHTGNETIYIRIGTTSVKATREQQARLFAIGGMLHTEIMPVSGTSFNSLDKARLENYLRDIISDPEIPSTEDEWIDRLLGLGFLVEGSDSNCFCTIAGIVLFGKNPRRFLKQSGIRVFAFDNIQKEYKALLDELINSPLVGRWDNIGTEKKLVDNGLIESFIQIVEPFISEEPENIDNNFRREKKWFYPRESVRETLINALAHRDWTKSIEIEVGIYSDRIEIISPGAMQNSMTVGKMIAGQRSPRNTIIMDVLRDYGYVDSRGMGVRTKVIPLMQKMNNTVPIFEATEDYLKTTLPKREK